MRAIVPVPLRPLDAASWASSVAPGARFDLSQDSLVCHLRDLDSDDQDAPVPDDAPDGRARVTWLHGAPRLTWLDAEAALAAVVARRYGVQPGQVTLTLGANQAIIHALLAVLRPGDHVVVERPTYEPLFRVPEMLGASVSRIDRRFEDGWQLVPERLAKVLTSRTRVVVLTNLHSPSGVACSPRTLAEIAALAARVGALVLVDEVLLDFAFDLDQSAACRPACIVADNAISFSSTSKGLGLPSLRIGWLVTRDPDAARDLKIAPDYLHARLPATTARLAAAALGQADELAQRGVRLAAAGRRVVERWSQGEPRVECVLPHAGFHMLLRLPKGISDQAFATHLRARYETQVVPGGVLEAPGHVRLNLAAGAPVLEQGLANLSAALDDLLLTDGPPRAAA